MIWTLRDVAERLGLLGSSKEDSLCLPMQYLLGVDNPAGLVGYITMCSFDTQVPPRLGMAAWYVNLYVEEGELPEYGPYRRKTGTAGQYNEGVPIFSGAGFKKNLHRQLDKVVRLGGKYIELDNRDAYSNDEYLDTLDWIQQEYPQIKGVFCKNPDDSDLSPDPVKLLKHRLSVGVIVERGETFPQHIEAWRKAAGKPNLPVWFVAYGYGIVWAGICADSIKKNNYKCMGVSHSNKGEYGNSVDVYSPRKP